MRPSASTPEVTGASILSMLAAMGAFRKTGEQILAEHGITRLTGAGWYPLDAYIASLTTIANRIGPNTLFRIGKEIPNHAQLPPAMDDFAAVAAAFPLAFTLNHRGVPGEAVVSQLTGPEQATVVCATPYPCDFDRGVIEGLFEKLLGITVRHEHDPSACKKRGDARCVHHVTRVASVARVA